MYRDNPEGWEGDSGWGTHVHLWLTYVIEASLVAQMVKCLPAMRATQIRSLGWEDLLEKEMETHSSILAWRIPWTEELVCYSPWGCKELDTTEGLHSLTPSWQKPPKYCKVISLQLKWINKLKRNSACQCRRPGFGTWVGKIPWRRAQQFTPAFLSGKLHGQRSLAGYSPCGCEKPDTTELYMQGPRGWSITGLAFTVDSKQKVLPSLQFPNAPNFP